ncbi:methyltransferase domain-containing protein [Salinisphaera sp. P385]|uniref:Methyltransferase domain-containing protein n=1 Tax=Spectribacter acetivorans TaxID=3075603 RepID=A0ABU3B8M5_9GAMM|nr:methyltransferase domain-containing protein [Salinisphaera sp. P385]MDT0618829.1 methyltransferase domain-containing protein [Salinisphaera sp. P385]
MAASEYSEVVQTARSYYNSDDADTFYYTVWGGEDIHIGLYQDEVEPIRDASRRTVAAMADRLSATPDSRAIDLGGAYGGSPRYLAAKFGCHVVSLNLSEVQNQRARQQTADAGLSDQVTVVDGNFENIPYEDNSFDIAWSQDSFLHSGNRDKVMEEIKRVLKPGGELIFTDPMETENATRDQLQPVLDRIQLESMGSPQFYERKLGELGFEKVAFEDHSEQLPRHYGRVKQELESRYDELLGTISQTYLDNMITGLGHWVDNGRAGNLCWGIFHFKLPG